MEALLDREVEVGVSLPPSLPISDAALCCEVLSLASLHAIDRVILPHNLGDRPRILCLIASPPSPG